MSLGDCPFVARPGARPAALAGRSVVLDLVLERTKLLTSGTPADPIVVTGRYGSGRSCLGDEIARRARRAKWSPAVIAIDSATVVMHEVARGVAAMVLRRLAVADDDLAAVELLAVTKSLAGAYGLDLPLDTGPASIAWSGDPAEDLAVMFRHLGDAAVPTGSGYLLVVDDVDRAVDKEAVATAVALAQAAAVAAEAGLPVLVVFTGLPGTAALLGLASVEVVLGPLAPAEVAEAVVRPARAAGVEVPTAVIASIGRRAGGHPFFVQALARAAWEAAEGTEITVEAVEAGSVRAEQQLVAEFFGPVLEELSAAERRFLRTMAEVDRPTFAALGRMLGDANRFDPASSQLAAVRESLLARRVIFELDGVLAYALPFFERYVTATS